MTIQESRYAWVVVWASFACLAVAFGVGYSFAAFFESFAAEFDARRADVSLVFGLFGLLYFVLGAGGGILADRFGPGRVVFAGMLAIAAALATASFATSLSTVYAAYGAGIGVGMALVYTPAIGCVQPWFTRRRGLAAGVASSGIGAGTLAVPLLAAAAIAALDWREALQAMAAGVLVVGCGAAALLRRAPVAAAAGTGRMPGATLREALLSAHFRWLYLAVLIASGAIFVPFAHVSVSARDMGIAESQAVGLVGVIGIGSLVGRFGIGALADRLGRIATLVLAAAAGSLSFVLWLVAPGYATLAAFALCFGVSYGGIVSLLPAICMDLFGARAVSSIIGALYTSAAVGHLLGPVLAGAAFDRFGSYTPVIAGCIAMMAGSAAASWQLARLRAAAHSY
jgi:MFS family permease